MGKAAYGCTQIGFSFPYTDEWQIIMPDTWLCLSCCYTCVIQVFCKPLFAYKGYMRIQCFVSGRRQVALAIPIYVYRATPSLQ
jgi:hypothetical protein